MHNNYYFLKRLTPAIVERFRGTVVSQCFSQSKDELVLQFEGPNSSLFIKANLLPEFSCLSFPSEYHRARKNSVDLFHALIGRKLLTGYQYQNERSFQLTFDDQYHLLFNLHGTRSNLLLFHGNAVQELFKKKLQQDHHLQMADLNREIDWSYAAFEKNINYLPKLYFTFGKLVWGYLQEKNFSDKPIDQRWEMIQTIRTQLESSEYYLVRWKHRIYLSMIPLGEILARSTDPIGIINQFYNTYLYEETFSKEKRQATTLLSTKIKSIEEYLRQTQNKLTEISQTNRYKEWADLLMAYMHQTKPGTTSTILPDFETGKPIEIKLKRELTPQKNAENYYRKAKNQILEITHLEKMIATKKLQHAELTQLHERLLQQSNLKGLRELLKNINLGKETSKKGKKVPYYDFEYMGYQIWVGKNATHNDELTLKYGYKEDLWLHAKDVPGSHVLIKWQPGKNIPKEVIEYAAQLAAYYSKRKNEALCPVAITSKKYVRKRKGDAPGAMVVEREEVLLVEPKSHNRK